MRDWRPRDTYVLVLGLGLSDWEDPDDPHWRRHALLADFFRQAGVPEEQVLVWEDEAGHPDAMRENLPAFLANTREGALFFFYYCGHGYMDDDFYFCHPETEDAVSSEELFGMIEENFWGSQAVLLADCCHSGALARAVEAREADVAYCALTSATDSVESTGNWTFTDCILAGLRGEHGMDRNGDGMISFQELAAYVIDRMKKVEEQPADHGHSEGFDPSFRLALVSRMAAPRRRAVASAT